MIALGIDTSNYATSAALFDGERILAHAKRFLPVKEGALGIRQSNAVFLHTKALPEVLDELFSSAPGVSSVDCIGCSSRPRAEDGSYMPCFLVGQSAAECAAKAAGVKAHCFSHRQGHIAAALYGCGLLGKELSFCAFHVSGGTTDLCRCDYRSGELKVKTVASSLDLYAGQTVDRVGAMLGLRFPAGEQLSGLAARSSEDKFLKPVLKDGSCCLSGLENVCRRMLDGGAAREDVARFCLLSVGETVAAMVEHEFKLRGRSPLIFAGGVMSSAVLRPVLAERFPQAGFCEPAWLSADNALGVAALAVGREAGR